MASSYKIPKKKQPAGSDSAPLHMQSPLSRLQSPSPQTYANQSGRGGANRTLSWSTPASSANSQSAPLFQDVVKNLLGVCGPNRALAANHRAAGNNTGQSRPGQSSTCLSNGWRPKRASDRLLQPVQASKPQSPPQKKKCDLGGQSSVSSGLSPAFKSVAVKSVDSLAELRAQEPRTEQSCGDCPEKKTSSEKPPRRDLCRSPIPTATPEKRRSLDRTPGCTVSNDLLGDLRERERRKWTEFRDKKKTRTSSAVLHLRLKRRETQTPAEPIVLSSEEDEEEENEGHRGQRTPQSRSTGVEPRLRDAEADKARQASSSKGETKESPPPSFLQLQFSSLHAGLMHADANGELMITDHGVTVPLKGVEEGQVTVVASQVRGYSVWDGGVAKGGTLLADWSGPAPSLLFLWVTDAQANLLQRELSDIQSTSGPPCPVLLLVLQEQLQELQAALLNSILDMDEYRRGRCSSSPCSPLEWTDGLLLLHSCPPPLDQHLLALLGHSQDKSSGSRSVQRTRPRQQLSSRLIQYPPAPCRGRISVSKEDLACLASGEFLNDVIVDFYLKYLLLEGVGGPVAERTHVFSSFFFRQLSRRRAAGEDHAPSVPDGHVRHQRVKTWTRHVDIFSKDFLFVPVNQEAHWFLVVVCFPGLEEVQYVEFQSPKGESGDAASLSRRPQQPPDCTEQGRRRNSVLKRPCVLVMDSLKLSYHDSVCRLLREYLQVEWEVRRGTPRLFTSDSMRSSNCRVPLQDNSSDCGLYLLQYAESFLQNPVVHFDLPLHLENWFPRQRVRQKREEIRSLILSMHRSQRTELN